MEKQEVIIARFQEILDNLLQPNNFAISNNIYYEQLLMHLGKSENSYLLKTTAARKWVDRCFDLIVEDFDKVHPKVFAFMLNVCSLMTRDEWIVIQMRETKATDKLLVIIERDMNKLSPSIKLGTIRLFAAISRYGLGLIYLRSHKVCRFLIEYCKKDHTLYVLREAHQLIYELLYKYAVKAKQEEIVLEIIDELMKPLHENVWKEHNECITVNVEDSELQHKLSSTLDLLAYIFQKTIESEEKTNLSQLFKAHHQVELTLWKLTEMSQNQAFVGKLLTVLSSYYFAKCIDDKWTEGQISSEDFNEFGVSFFNLMKFCVTRQDCLNFLKLAEINHILWRKLGTRAPAEIQIQTERVRFENQLIIFHVLPVLFLVTSFKEEEMFDNYLLDLFNVSCEHTLRICYAYRDNLFIAADLAADIKPICAEMACRSIHSVLSMERILERDQAVLVFKAVIYALKQLIINTNTTLTTDCSTASPATRGRGGGNAHMHYDKQPEPCTELIIDMPNVLYAVLIGLQKLIERYHISWKESIESVCLVNLLTVILENPNLSTRLAVQAIKLVQLAVEHFLSPNMALLVDNLNGSGLVSLGPLVNKRFHDIAWEVRDSTLELVTSMVHISYLKFPAFRQFLVDHKVTPIVFEMARNDGEPFVRASALKCLTEMVKITLIWESCLIKLNVVDHLFFVLCNESEGIVRNEAVKTLTKIYKHRKISQECRATLFSTMAHCVVVDLHWEVKVNALMFWELEIEKQFTNQGMIDGTFPSVTFSTENKKIVKLTDKEVKIRIAKVFIELSQLGCLGVILKCLNEDYDIEVIRVAVTILQRLLEKIKNYDYKTLIKEIENVTANNLLSKTSSSSSSLSSKPSTQNKLNSNSMEIDATAAAAVSITPTTSSPAATSTTSSIGAAANADDVIESILSAQDINLLVTAYENQLNINPNSRKVSIDEEFYKQYTNISAKDFVVALKDINLDKLLHSHQEWMLSVESFPSLLDDILHVMKPPLTATNMDEASYKAADNEDLNTNDRNVADCY